MVRNCLSLAAVLAITGCPAFGTISGVSLRPSVASPQVIGTSVSWTATAVDSNAGPLTFQFWITAPGGTAAMIKDYNLGGLKKGRWISQAFAWVPTASEGVYSIQVNVKDFASGETGTRTAQFQVKPLVTGGTPVAVSTANPLVALFSAPSCAAGS